MIKFPIIISIIVLGIFTVRAQGHAEKIIFSDKFENGLFNWIIEQVTGGTTEIKDGKLDVNDKNGCTIWLNHKLPRNFRVIFDVVMIDNGGIYDHVRDLNFFFKAVDPMVPENIFANSEKRAGIFANYNHLRTYYIGYGGNRNSSTRFRKYPGDGSRPLLPSHDLSDEKYLNIANLKRHVEITCHMNKITFKVDELVVFDIDDENAFSEGWFAFRTVDNHMSIDNFYVYAL
jgi:hypothetical protein